MLFLPPYLQQTRIIVVVDCEVFLGVVQLCEVKGYICKP